MTATVSTTRSTAPASAAPSTSTDRRAPTSGHRPATPRRRRVGRRGQTGHQSQERQLVTPTVPGSTPGDGEQRRRPVASPRPGGPVHPGLAPAPETDRPATRQCPPVVRRSPARPIRRGGPSPRPPTAGWPRSRHRPAPARGHRPRARRTRAPSGRCAIPTAATPRRPRRPAARPPRPGRGTAPRHRPARRRGRGTVGRTPASRRTARRGRTGTRVGSAPGAAGGDRLSTPPSTVAPETASDTPATRRSRSRSQSSGATAATGAPPSSSAVAPSEAFRSMATPRSPSRRLPPGEVDHPGHRPFRCDGRPAVEDDRGRTEPERTGATPGGVVSRQVPTEEAPGAGDAPSGGGHEELAVDRIDVDLTGAREVRGDDEGRDRAAQGLDQGVEPALVPVTGVPGTRRRPRSAPPSPPRRPGGRWPGRPGSSARRRRRASGTRSTSSVRGSQDGSSGGHRSTTAPGLAGDLHGEFGPFGPGQTLDPGHERDLAIVEGEALERLGHRIRRCGRRSPAGGRARPTSAPHASGRLNERSAPSSARRWARHDRARSSRSARHDDADPVR